MNRERRGVLDALARKLSWRGGGPQPSAAVPTERPVPLEMGAPEAFADQNTERCISETLKQAEAIFAAMRGRVVNPRLALDYQATTLHAVAVLLKVQAVLLDNLYLLRTGRTVLRPVQQPAREGRGNGSEQSTSPIVSS